MKIVVPTIGHLQNALTPASLRPQSHQAVIEITPGGGWYSELLAPLLRDQGTLTAAIIDPSSVTNKNAQTYYTNSNQALRDKFGAAANLYDQVKLQEFNMASPNFGDNDSADMVVTFRNVHNWMNAGTAEENFGKFYAALKPGGILSVSPAWAGSIVRLRHDHAADSRPHPRHAGCELPVVA
ncbi:MAG: methyltransferase domain-containing protein, partial [Anaerolineae bacterium]|nr:methyltransferase domain-containing protein [Anaerolineae bacterium]